MIEKFESIGSDSIDIQKLTTYQVARKARGIENLKIIESQSIYCQLTLNVNYLINLLARINIMKTIELKEKPGQRAIVSNIQIS